ncbi:3813_t:CDS:10 [Paraglomus brasilianum]|uniref:Mitochondrial import inner membrane translocase subunit TIM50 n=1 Tax=Paraglomus brasilianum TaxID=144538 RepID=A0A9N8WP75_9GLOM|nr:3813_t:CDS:10 [Paraglomus brasilianum]
MSVRIFHRLNFTIPKLSQYKALYSTPIQARSAHTITHVSPPSTRNIHPIYAPSIQFTSAPRIRLLQTHYKSYLTEVTPPKPRSRPRKPSSNIDAINPKMKKFLSVVGVTMIGSTIALILYSGRPFESDRENKYKDLGFFAAWYKRLRARFEDLLQFFMEPPSDKLLQDKDTLPNFPPLTLVINLEETLIHSTWDRQHGWRFAKRPGLDYFLAYMANLYELVIWTAQPTYTAEPLLLKLDPLGMAPFKLTRDQTRYVDGKHVKDLSKLNRDLSKVIIMDSDPDAYSLQPENAIYVPPWNGDPKDTFLIDIIPFLEYFILFDVQDVLPIIKMFQNEKNLPQAFAEWEKNWKEQSRLEWEKAKQPKKGLASWAFTLGGGHVQHEVTPVYQAVDLRRKYMRDEFNSHYKNIKEQAPQFQKMIQEEQKQFEQMHFKQLKDSKMTVWELITQGPPPPPVQPSDFGSSPPPQQNLASEQKTA